MTLGADEIALRVQRTDPSALRRSVRTLQAAAEELRAEQQRLRALPAAGGPTWSGAAYRAWADHLALLCARLGQAGWVLDELASLLHRLAAAIDCARDEFEAAERQLQAVPPHSPEAAPVVARIQARLQRTAEDYHAVERRIRGALWDLGDSAPLGPPPAPALLPPPARSWWQRLLDVGPFGAMWLPGRDGRPYGLDEDGVRVPAYRGHPIPLAVEETGVGDGLARLLPRVASGLRGKPVVAEGDVTEAFAQAIRESYGWRDAHIDKHIRQWYGMKDKGPIPAWMRQEFFDKVVRASVRPDRVVMGRLPDGKKLQPAYEVLYDDIATKRQLMVRYYVKGKYANQFATAFRPTKAQVDQFLRREAVPGTK